MPRTVGFLCTIISPLIGPVRFSITMKKSWNSFSPTSNFHSTVLYEVSSWPFATMIEKLGAVPSFTIDCGVRRRIFLRTASGIALDRAVCMSPSMVSSPKLIVKYNIRRLYLSPRFVDKATRMMARLRLRLGHKRSPFHR